MLNLVLIEVKVTEKLASERRLKSETEKDKTEITKKVTEKLASERRLKCLLLLLSYNCKFWSQRN